MRASVRAPWRLACLAALVMGACGPGDPDADSSGSQGSGGSGEPGSTTAVEGTSLDASSTADGGSGSGDASSTGAPSLPCAWVEGQFDADIPSGSTRSDVTCDPGTSTATIRLTYADALGCGLDVTGDRLTIELPPERQVAGEHDLTELVALIYMSADLRPVAGQVDTGTLIITEVTPTAIVGEAHGGLEGYDFVGSFEAPYCP